MTDDKLLKAVKQYKELRNQAAALNERAELFGDVIKSEMMLRKLEKLAIGAFKINYSERSYEKFDIKEFKKSHGGLYAEFVKNETRRYFSIT